VNQLETSQKSRCAAEEAKWEKNQRKRNGEAGRWTGFVQWTVTAVAVVVVVLLVLVLALSEGNGNG